MMPTILRRPDVGYAMRLKTSTRLKPWLGGPILRRAMPASFKAVLVFLRIDFPRVHDLDTLRALVPQDWPFRDEHLRLGGLTEWEWDGGDPALRARALPPGARLRHHQRQLQAG